MQGHLLVTLIGAALWLNCAATGASAQQDTSSDLLGDAITQVDQCASGRHGVAFERVDPDPVVFELPLNTDQEPPRRGFSDPCGLRFLDLSGVWSFDGLQAVVYHNLRTREFKLRLTHIPYDEPLFQTWARRFGHQPLVGVIGPDGDAVSMTANIVYPPRFEAVCPDQYQQDIEMLAIRMGYDSEGRVMMELDRMRSFINDSCEEDIREFVTTRITRTGVEGA